MTQRKWRAVVFLVGDPDQENKVEFIEKELGSAVEILLVFRLDWIPREPHLRKSLAENFQHVLHRLKPDLVLSNDVKQLPRVVFTSFPVREICDSQLLKELRSEVLTYRPAPALDLNPF